LIEPFGDRLAKAVSKRGEKMKSMPRGERCHGLVWGVARRNEAPGGAKRLRRRDFSATAASLHHIAGVQDGRMVARVEAV
jgi:cation transport regulator ChaC